MACLLVLSLGIFFVAWWPLLLLLTFPSRRILLQVTVLDLGQGLAVTVETENLTLVYDSGNQFSEQFSTGSGIVAPYLWQRGRGQLDATIISHEDGDHSGGYPSLEQVLPSQRLLVGPAVMFDDKLQQQIIKERKITVCQRGQSWHWDGVDFLLLGPANRSTAGNISSCVLQLVFKTPAGREVTVLLPGDIERSAELAFLQEAKLNSSVDLVVAPHHGSRTSSTAAFVEHLTPGHVVFSTGYRHHFNHPHPAIVARYRQQGSMLWDTGEQGAIKFRWLRSGELQIDAARDRQRRWWR